MYRLEVEHRGKTHVYFLFEEDKKSYWKYKDNYLHDLEEIKKDLPNNTRVKLIRTKDDEVLVDKCMGDRWSSNVLWHYRTLIYNKVREDLNLDYYKKDGSLSYIITKAKNGYIGISEQVPLYGEVMDTEEKAFTSVKHAVNKYIYDLGLEVVLNNIN